MSALTSPVRTTSFAVSWSGQDGGGSGVAAYDVYVSNNGGAFTRWLSGTPTTSGTYSGANDGHTYGFATAAIDNLGNRRAAPDGKRRRASSSI